MGTRPDVSVVIVSYNSGPFLERCIGSLDRAAAQARYELIVADNASSDDSAERVRRIRPDAVVIETGGNLGFAKAVNRALLRAAGRHVLLLNPDTEAAPGAIDRLVQFLDSTPTAGIAAPRLLNTDLSDQGTARSFPTAAAVLFGRRSFLTRVLPRNRWSRRYLIGRDHSSDTPFAVDWVSGACLMARREAIETVGPLDEGFFMYWEDADWCRRVKAAGFGVWCVPTAEVVHHEGRSSIGRPPRLVWVFHRSVYRYYAKYHARGAWDPLRSLVNVVLAARAMAIIVADRIVKPGAIPGDASVPDRR